MKRQILAVVALLFILSTAVCSELKTETYKWEVKIYQTRWGVIECLEKLERWQVELAKIHSWQSIVYVYYPVRK